MIFRWLHERVAYKPWRPWVQIGVRLLASAVGITGKSLKSFWSFIRATPKQEALNPSQLRSIVVIRPDRIGDAVLSTPALRALRQAAPNARICVIASKRNAPLFKALSSVDEVIAIEGDRLLDWWKRRNDLRPLRGSKQDLVVVMQSAWPAAWLGWWLRGQRRVGYDAEGMGWLFTDAVAYPFLKRKAHQVVVNLHLLEAVGIPVPSAEGAVLEVPVANEAREAANTWLSKNRAEFGKLIIIHPGSRSSYTQWAPERFAAVADELAADTGNQVVLLCGPNEEAILERVLAGMKQRVLVAKDLPLETIIALLARSAIFIGNATGTMHLASAVCRKVVSIIGGTHPQDCPERWRPWGKGHRVVHKTPEETIGRSTWDWVGPEGLKFITPEDVLAVIHD